MSDETGVVDAGGEAAPVISPANLDSTDTYSPEQALEAYQKRTNPTAESAALATAETESADEADAAPAEQANSEDTEDADPEDKLPPIERPKSWTKDVDDLWQTLPREMQEKVASREQDRDRELRRSQNEAADIRKAAEAAQKAADDARKGYEGKVPTLEDLQRFVSQGPFADIKNQDDADALAANDPFRYLQWDAYQKRLAGAAEESRGVQQQKAHERQNKRASYEAEQNKLLVELVPEMADPKKASELRERAVAMLNDDLGLKTDQLSRWMQDDTGHEILSNAGIQKLIADRLKFLEIKAAPPKAIPKSIPAVQKPGIAPPKGVAAANNVQALRNKLTGSGSVDDAFALYLAKQSRTSS